MKSTLLLFALLYPLSLFSQQNSNIQQFKAHAEKGEYTNCIEVLTDYSEENSLTAEYFVFFSIAHLMNNDYPTAVDILKELFLQVPDYEVSTNTVRSVFPHIEDDIVVEDVVEDGYYLAAKNSMDLTMYDKYLERYPAGIFKGKIREDKGVSYFRLAEYEMNRAGYSKATSYYKKSIKSAPNGEHVEKANKRVKEIKDIKADNYGEWWYAHVSLSERYPINFGMVMLVRNSWGGGVSLALSPKFMQESRWPNDGLDYGHMVLGDFMLTRQIIFPLWGYAETGVVLRKAGYDLHADAKFAGVHFGFGLILAYKQFHIKGGLHSLNMMQWQPTIGLAYGFEFE